MKTNTISDKACFITLLLIFTLALFSCTVTTGPDGSFTVSFPTLQQKYDLYYVLENTARSIEMVFSEEIDENTVQGSINFSDITGSLNDEFDLEVYGKIITLQFHSDFFLNAGWKYLLTITTGLRSVSGNSFRTDQEIQFRTTGLEIGTSGNSIVRDAIVCISDVHMGDQRATDGGYCWFDKNADALTNFLDYVINWDEVKELVIMGDLFDEWLVPYDITPFDSTAQIQSSKDYFQAIANNPTNVPIFDRLRTIAGKDELKLVYIPGNHDMLMEQSYLDEIIPNTDWEGHVAGLGVYSPVDGIIMEHGHRYDLFNCPQPLINHSHILPPGYFITRLYAEGMASQNPLLHSMVIDQKGSFEFYTGWTLAFLKVLSDFNMDCPPMYDQIIKMSGIDCYNDPFSFNSAYEMYADSIETLWQQTQTVNQVPVPIPVALGIFDGVDLSGAPIVEYMINPSTHPYKIIAFGHSHNPHISVYPLKSYYTNIYANSGSWVDQEWCDHDVRTFLVIKPGAWTGSELDLVMLYRFDLDTSGDKEVYKLILLAEESIEVD